MKSSFIVYAALVCLVFVIESTRSQSFFPTTCNLPVTSYCSRSDCKIWYVDPVNGKANGNGSLTLPWKNFTTALSQVKSRSVPGNSPYPPTTFTDKNPSGVIQAGDVIVLRNGNHGPINIVGYYNTLPVTVVGEPGSRPVVDTFTLTSSANWTIKCINVTTSSPNPDQSIVTIQSSWSGPAYSNIFAYNSVFSYPSLEFFRGKPQSYLFNASATGIYTRDSKGLKIFGNYIYYVKRGIVMMSPNTYIAKNTINYFIGDGMRLLHNDSVIEYNLIQNNMNVDGGADHRDCMQMFTNGNAFTLKNITIRGNRCFANVDTNRPFPDGFQGIVSFDVRLFNIVVENNLVVTYNFYHGVALWKSQDCKIFDNTLMDVTTFRSIWVTTEQGYSGNLIQNNIAFSGHTTDGSTLVANSFKQWSLVELKSYFIDPLKFNFHLKANASSPFIGTGNATSAPTLDLDGNLRSGAYDRGCYAYAPKPAPPSASAIGAMKFEILTKDVDPIRFSTSQTLTPALLPLAIISSVLIWVLY